jgi:hypothetical protein
MNSPPTGQPYVAGSMEPYKYEVFQQCFASTEAWNRALSRLENVPQGGPGAPMLAALQIISDLQGFAVAVGILSDLFFPTPGKGDVQRGVKLRALYGVQAGSSRLENAHVLVRHALVHLDQDLDQWLKKQVGRQVGPVAIEPWHGSVPPMASVSHARIIDNENWRLMVLGKVMEFRPLLLEVGRISTLFPLELDTPSGKLRIAISPPK